MVVDAAVEAEHTYRVWRRDVRVDATVEIFHAFRWLHRWGDGSFGAVTAVRFLGGWCD